MNATSGNLRLAIYGKGGIGKSMIAANLSAAFAAMGKSVLQIGCDPKHDSTRLLLHGRTLETVLEHLENPTNQADMIRFRRNLMSPQHTVAEVIAAGRGKPEGLERQNVLHTGFGGVVCIEAGGPRPGVGCAGRGIITTFELLQKLDVDPNQFDVVLYDVLGDVVCGGFGVPMRHEHANAILLVSSEEYMPIFAANNILRGVRSYDRQERRLTGLFLNRRDNCAPRAMMDRFASAAELPVVAEMPRSATIQQADRLGMTLAEAFPESAEAGVFRQLAELLLAEASPRFGAHPMTDEELELAVLGRSVTVLSSAPQAGSAAAPRSREMPGEPRRLAVYGKGGIGKSTISANISATLASRGLRVLQIGCDPKHDSTRLLLGGHTVRTVLEYLRDVAETDRRLDEVVHPGLLGIDCAEVGGPEPGIGCAGRGILSAFTLLEKLGLRESDYDVIVYDVLGDVVCGGFAIPLRKGYAQSVLLVTSEEYMPLYAANNILRGINGVAGIDPRVLGVFHNVRDNDADISVVERFAKTVGLPVISRLKRSTVVQEAEQASQPLVAFAPLSDEAAVFEDLVGRLLGSAAHYPATPLEGDDFDRVILGRAVEKAEPSSAPTAAAHVDLGDTGTFTQAVVDLHFCNFEQAPHEPYYYRIKPIRQPVWGCAFQSAVRTALRVKDAVVVAHSPRSCSHMCRSGICSGASKDLKRRGKYDSDPLAPNLVCTDMTVPHMIYGGTELLTDTLKTVLAGKPPVVFLATACPPAIIGDDVAGAIRQAQAVSPETRIIPLRSDGNMSGAGINGHLSALFDGILRLSESAPGGPVIPYSVNLLGDWTHEQSNVIRGILGDVGISVNTSFSVNDHNPRVADLRQLSRAPLTLIGAMNFGMTALAKHLREKFNTRLGTYPFPRGFRETAIWLREIGEFFGIQERVEAYLAPRQTAYEATLAECRTVLAGKRVLIFGGPSNWILDVMLDCGIEVPLVAVMGKLEDIHQPIRHRERVLMEFEFHPKRRREVYDTHKPDAVFVGSRHDLPEGAVTLDTVGVTEEDIGFGVERIVARRWANLLATGLREKWRDHFTPSDKRQLAMERGRGGGGGGGGRF